MKYLIILALFLGTLTSTSCRKDKVEEVKEVDPNCPDTISFSQEVLPILNTNCNTSGCHDPGTQSAGYNFDSHSVVETTAEDILKAIKHESGVSNMPQGEPQLPDSTIKVIDCWVKQGKLNN